MEEEAYIFVGDLAAKDYGTEGGSQNTEGGGSPRHIPLLGFFPENFCSRTGLISRND